MIYEQVRLYLTQHPERFITIKEIKRATRLKSTQIQRVLAQAYKLGWVTRIEKPVTKYRMLTAYKIKRSSTWLGINSYYNKAISKQM